MKIAYFSPMPPAKTGIATYSSHLVPVLADHLDITVFTWGESTWKAPPNCSIVNFKADPFALKSLTDYDQIVYHLGNNPWFHLDIYKVFLQYPGCVVLHDLVLYFLIAGFGRGGLIKEFCENYGSGRLTELWDLIASCPENDILRYQHPEHYPFLLRVLKLAKRIIVHNQTSAAQLVALGIESRVDVVPLIYYPDQTADSFSDSQIQKAKNDIGINTNEILIGIFGFIGPTKRIDKVLQAVRRLCEENSHAKIRILIIGEGNSLKKEIAAAGLGRRVIELGFVPDDRFKDYLAAVDIVANLRYPSMGESSVSLIQAMALGKPVLVTNHAFFSEFPDDVVAKVSYGTNEIHEIADALRLLIENKSKRKQLGLAARNYVETHYAPDIVAKLYMDSLGKNLNEKDNCNDKRHLNRENMSSWAEKYLCQRMTRLIP
jgi:glycosyltransferase involved in cell wall biosynthesis